MTDQVPNKNKFSLGILSKTISMLELIALARSSKGS